MLTRTQAVSAVTAMTILSGGSAGADDSLTLSGELTISSAYLWRGQQIRGNSVMQQSIDIVYGGWTCNAWSSVDLQANSRGLHEFDLTFSYERSIAHLEFGAGIIQYAFPNTGVPSTRELYLTLATTTLPIDVSVAVNRDVEVVDGTYFNMTLGKTWALSEASSIDLGTSAGWGSAGWNGAYFGRAGAALNDANISIGTTIKVSPTLSVRAGLAYTWLLNGAVRDAADTIYGRHDRLYLSSGLGYSF